MIEDRILFRQVKMEDGSIRTERIAVEIRYPGGTPEALPIGGVSATPWHILQRQAALSPAQEPKT